MVRELNKLVRKLNAVLGARLKDYRSELHRSAMDERVLGWIVSSNFEGLGYLEREKIVRGVLESELTADELRLLGPLLPYTPAEVSLQESA